MGLRLWFFVLGRWPWTRHSSCFVIRGLECLDLVAKPCGRSLLAKMDWTSSGERIKPTKAPILGACPGVATPPSEHLACRWRTKDLGKKSQPIRFHPEVLNPLQKKILQQLGPILMRQHYYLGGGATIAIYLGHRHSVDLDWFTEEGITDPMRLAQNIRDKGIPFVTGQIERGTLHGTISGVRISFLEYKYPLLKPLIIWQKAACQLATLEDLACMKLSALTQRGSKKDFVDIYALGLRYFSLRDMLRLYQKKFSVEDMGHVLYGLSYFDDADKERLPKMFWDTDWRTIKKTIQGWVKEVAGSKTF